MFMVCAVPAVRTVRTVLRHDCTNGRTVGSRHAGTVSNAVSGAVAESGTAADADARHGESVRRKLQRSVWITVYAAAHDAVSARSVANDIMATDARSPWSPAKSLAASPPRDDDAAIAVRYVGTSHADADDAYDAESHDGFWLLR